MTSNQAFLSLFINTVVQVPFDAAWDNGTGYMDGAVHFTVVPGSTVKSVDLNGRKIVLMGTDLGTLTVFQRRASDDTVIVYNAPTGWRQVFQKSTSGQLTADDVYELQSTHPQTVIATQKAFWVKQLLQGK